MTSSRLLESHALRIRGTCACVRVCKREKENGISYEWDEEREGRDSEC